MKAQKPARPSLPGLEPKPSAHTGSKIIGFRVEGLGFRVRAFDPPRFDLFLSLSGVADVFIEDVIGENSEMLGNLAMID